MTSQLSAWLALGWLCLGAAAYAAEEPISQAPCGVIESFLGDVQILDPSRTHLVDASVRAAIPCGSWISVNQGWAQIRHLNGPHIHLSSQTFVQLPDPRNDPQFKGDHLVLYRGQAYVQSGGGEDEFHVLSAAARARIKRGKIIFVYNYRENESQLITLDNYATLENRFEPSKKMKVRAGEASELSFKLLRVLPTLPKAVSVASLRPRLAQLRLGENDQFDAIRAALHRQSRKFASRLVETSEESTAEDRKKPHFMDADAAQPKRGLASEEKPNPYLRHQPGAEDTYLKNHWVEKMAGGEPVGERILFPDKFYGKSQRVQVKVIDPAEKFNQKSKAQEDAEKKRLIEELSQIRVE